MGLLGTVALVALAVLLVAEYEHRRPRRHTRMQPDQADRWLRARMAEIVADRDHESLARRVRCPEVH